MAPPTRGWPGSIRATAAGRQPVHTVYVPADRVTPDVVPSWGKQARALLDRHAPDAGAFARALQLADDDADALGADGGWQRLLAKLDTEPIEDLRIDFEDGYGGRADDEEDRDAVAAARALVEAGRAGVAPPFSGHAVQVASRRRPGAAGCARWTCSSATLLDAGGLPDGFVITLPKVTSVEQVDAMVEACARLEAAYGLPDAAAAVRDPGRDAAGRARPDGTAPWPG